MPEGEIDLVDLIYGPRSERPAGSQEIAGPGGSASTPLDTLTPQDEGLDTGAPSATVEVPVEGAAVGKVRWRGSRGRGAPKMPKTKRKHPRVRSAVQLTVAFVFGGLLCVGIGAAIVMGINNEYQDKVAPGVHIGALDLGGMTRDEAVSAIDKAYGYLGLGNVSLATPTGTGTLTYAQAGRGPDTQFMVDEAMQVGHSGYLIDDAVNIGRAAFNGYSIPIAVRLDPGAVATSLRQLNDQTEVRAADASVSLQNGVFNFRHAVIGARLNESVLASAIVSGLSVSDAPSNLQIGGALLTFDPAIGDADAQQLIATTQRMFTNIQLVWGGSSPTPTPKAAKSPLPVDPYLIDAKTVRQWISIGRRPDGTVGPMIDENAIQAYITPITEKIYVAPKEPKMTFDAKTGKPTIGGGGVDGKKVDIAATADSMVAYLKAVAEGTAPASMNVDMVVSPVPPVLNVDSIKSYVAVGAWSTTFYPGITNGNGANIRIPAKLLDGIVVPAGGHFDFLRSVAPIDAAHGWKKGGVIQHGKSNYTGAIGGGICSASTTMFNAAARAGLQIDERHPHAYYIDRYPVGLDATVYANGAQVLDLRWTNDTLYPIIIHSWTTGRAVSHITVQLWSMPTGRTVAFSPSFKANVSHFVNHTQYTDKLAVGTKAWAEIGTDGFSTSRTRTVKDATGKVIHTETWASKYIRVDGLLQVGCRAGSAVPCPGA
jgi:vancomycin resistance protein YoaR